MVVLSLQENCAMPQLFWREYKNVSCIRWLHFCCWQRSSWYTICDACSGVSSFISFSKTIYSICNQNITERSSIIDPRVKTNQICYCDLLLFTTVAFWRTCMSGPEVPGNWVKSGISSGISSFTHGVYEQLRYTLSVHTLSVRNHQDRKLTTRGSRWRE